jgi:prepilin-type N-terminal cleavage/methylation domain-containing protein
MKKAGFTLIELLIVVLIIAILAAIAVPNFLEAQVRAKVSRAKADMRTLATALEAYAADNLAYPIDVDYTMNWYYYIGDSVTTPIKYISGNRLNDPFRYGKTQMGWVYERFRYINYKQREAEPPGLAGTDFFPGGPIRYGTWKLSSAGPDGGADLPLPDYLFARFGGGQPPIIYDPTNGSASYGDIIRCQKVAEVWSEETVY